MSHNRVNDYQSSSRSETRWQSIGRKTVAFFLFLVITMLSAIACGNLYFLNGEKYAQVFANEQYVNGLYNDISEYAEDLCDYYAVPRACIESELTFDKINDIAVSYAYGNLTSAQQFTESTYVDKINELEESLAKSVNDTLKEQGIKQSGSVENGGELFAADIKDYICKKVEFVYMQKLKTAANIGKTASVAVCAAFAVIAVVLILVIISIGNKKYRSIRAIAYAVTASGELQLLSVLAVNVIKKYKTLVIYPSYLCDSVMRFVNNGVTAVCVSSMLSLLAALALTVAVWKLKRNQK